jgi:acyl-lipid omega-6 desaturase (Delta-12 desaturase)
VSETAQGPAPVSLAPTAESSRHNYWSKEMAPYARWNLGRALRDIATSVVPYLALSALAYLALDVSVWLALALTIPAAGFLLRTFIVFHDCAHGSFLGSRRANLWFGRFTALLVYQPFSNWRHNHAVHHGTSGDLERRGTGDVLTLTVDEYEARPWRGRLAYRLFRNPLVMFGIGPLWSLMFGPRMWKRSMRPRQVRSVIVTNAVLAVALGAFFWFLGVEAWLLTQLPAAILAGTAGVWLFYVQHQFEDAYWEDADSWSYADAALQGSSYLKLPKVLQFFTGNIGLHHVHHLSTKVPNYNLQRAHDETPIFADVPVLTFWDGIKAVRLKLWDAESGRMIGWREMRARRMDRATAAGRTAAVS